MGLYRDENGLVINTDDDFANARGFTPVSPEEEQQIYAERGLEQRADEGADGAVNAFANRAASSLTLGGSDVLLDQIMPPAEREQLQRDLEAHPIAGGIGEFAGAIAPTLAAPESLLGRTPAGYLSRAAGREVEAGLERGGIAGTARALNAMGAEGAAQGVGQYIGASAIQDKEATVEGAAGALGTGYAFGSLGGGAALGVVKGTVAARRMFSRIMDGSTAAKDAEQAWSLASQAALDADKATAEKLQQRLDEIQQAKRDAMRERASAKSAAQEEKIRARNATPRPTAEPEAAAPEPFEGPTPLDEGIAPATARDGGQTSIFTRPEPPEQPAFDPADAAAFDSSTSDRQALQDMADAIPQPEGKGTGVYKREGTGIFDTRAAMGVPAEASLPSGAADVVDDTVTTVPARAIKEHGFDSLSTPGVDKVKTSKAAKAIAEGQKEPITIAVSPGGRYSIEDGTHRLAAAIEADKPIKVKWARGSAALDEAPPTGYVVKGASEGETDLERQLAGTKKAVDEGKPLKEIKASKGNESNSIESWLSEKADYDSEMSQVRKLEDIKGAREQSIKELRAQTTADLLTPAIAKEEARIYEVLDEMKAARAAMERVNEALLSKGELTADQLAELRQDNPSVAGSPKALRRQRAMEKLDTAHEEALLRAQSAHDPSETGAWLKKAQEVEDLMNDLPPEKDIYWDLHDNISVIDRYEKALSEAVDVAGPEAHPVAQDIAKGAADAERDAERKMYERTTRAVDDEAEFGPTYKTPKERVQYAEERHLDAQRKLDEVKAQHAGVKDELAYTKRKVAEGERAKRAALKTSTKPGLAEKAGILEFLDIPGMPKPHDIPVIGPLLGTYLKYRTLRGALARNFGRVAATGDARMAVMAARTRDRIARAVDRSLGLIERGARTSMKAAPKLAGVVSRRIYDDGLEDAKKGAAISDLVAVRVRELAAYVSTPGAIEADVRKQLRDVSDPDLIAAAEQHRRAVMEYLLTNAPKAPEQGMMKTIDWKPSPAEAMSFARRYEAATAPADVWERVAAEDGMISLEAAEALRTCYPQLFGQAQQRVTARISEVTAKVPSRTRTLLTLLYQLPLDASLDPDNLKITQSVYERKPAALPAGIPAQPPTPSVAGQTNLTALYQTPADRSALRR